MNRPSFLRDLVGFLVGGIVAAVAAVWAAVLVSLALPAQGRRHDHTPEALMPLAVMFFVGGLIGRRGISADYYSDVLRPVIGTYLVFGVLCLIGCFASSVDNIPIDLIALAAVLGVVTSGVIASVVVSLLLLRLFPPKTDRDEIDT